jgi:hypothetical protein
VTEENTVVSCHRPHQSAGTGDAGNGSVDKAYGEHQVQDSCRCSALGRL